MRFNQIFAVAWLLSMFCAPVRAEAGPQGVPETILQVPMQRGAVIAPAARPLGPVRAPGSAVRAPVREQGEIESWLRAFGGGAWKGFWNAIPKLAKAVCDHPIQSLSVAAAMIAMGVLAPAAVTGFVAVLVLHVAALQAKGDPAKLGELAGETAFWAGLGLAAKQLAPPAPQPAPVPAQPSARMAAALPDPARAAAAAELRAAAASGGRRISQLEREIAAANQRAVLLEAEAAAASRRANIFEAGEDFEVATREAARLSAAAAAERTAASRSAGDLARMRSDVASSTARLRGMLVTFNTAPQVVLPQPVSTPGTLPRDDMQAPSDDRSVDPLEATQHLGDYDQYRELTGQNDDQNAPRLAN